MKQTRILMGMPITAEVLDAGTSEAVFDEIFEYFDHVDQTFSTYKPSSEISRINRRQLSVNEASDEMKTIFRLAEETKRQTNGYFNIVRNGYYDPSGIVKGWAIQTIAERLHTRGLNNFYIDAGGDIQAYGDAAAHAGWRVGIQSPFNIEEIIKVVYIKNQGIATSGTYVRGQHIYNPTGEPTDMDAVASLTVIGPNVYEADRFATAAFAMGKKGIEFIESLPGFEGYMVDRDGIATFTSGFEKYTKPL